MLTGSSDHTRGWDCVGFAFESRLICRHDDTCERRGRRGVGGGKRKERREEKREKEKERRGRRKKGKSKNPRETYYVQQIHVTEKHTPAFHL